MSLDRTGHVKRSRYTKLKRGLDWNERLAYAFEFCSVLFFSFFSFRCFRSVLVLSLTSLPLPLSQENSPETYLTTVRRRRVTSTRAVEGHQNSSLYRMPTPEFTGDVAVQDAAKHSLYLWRQLRNLPLCTLKSRKATAQFREMVDL